MKNQKGEKNKSFNPSLCHCRIVASSKYYYPLIMKLVISEQLLDHSGLCAVTIGQFSSFPPSFSESGRAMLLAKNKSHSLFFSCDLCSKQWGFWYIARSCCQKTSMIFSLNFNPVLIWTVLNSSSLFWVFTFFK